MSMIALDGHGNVSFEGKLRDKHVSRFALPEIVKELIASRDEMMRFYSVATEGDHKLVGQEKANFMVAIDELMQTVAAFRIQLQKYAGQPELVGCEHQEFRYNLWRQDYTFFIQGSLSVPRLQSVSSLSEWLHKTFVPSVDELEKSLIESLKDRNFSPDEVRLTSTQLENFLHELLILRYLAEYSALNH